MKLYYCANGNPRFVNIASDFFYGAQMPGKVYKSPEFIDLHPTNPPKQWQYIACLKRWTPKLASVHDWHCGRDIVEIMLRAEEIAECVTEAVVIIPKVPGTIRQIPREIGGMRVVLGYSVPTRHGRTDVDVSEFAGWDVHLLGGNPYDQIAKFFELSDRSNVISADGNIALKHANRGRFYWPTGDALARNRYWPTLIEHDGARWGDGGNKAGAPYEAFERSCRAIIRAWESAGISVELNSDRPRPRINYLTQGENQS